MKARRGTNMSIEGGVQNNPLTITTHARAPNALRRQGRHHEHIARQSAAAKARRRMGHEEASKRNMC